jgi:hypothetical protein
MSWRISSLLVLFSLALNGAFVGGYVSQTLGAKTNCTSECDCLPSLREKIGATESQWRHIEPRLAKFHEHCGAMCRSMNHDRQELLDLIAAPQPDHEAISTKKKEILAGQAQMLDLVVEQLLDEKELLSPEQQKVLFNMIRSCCCPDGGNCVPSR